jgi:ectoine hydroxylase-related dioxygenase (phytanoyl-CoA dioxygenase family)
MHPFIETDPSDDASALRARLDRDGYLFLRGLAPRGKLLRLRRDVLALCREAGWIENDAGELDSKWSGAGPFTEGEPPYMELYQRVIHLDSFKELPEDAVYTSLMEKLIGGPVLVHRRKIGRITFPNNVEQATGAHQDFFYIRGTPQTYTAWTPVGDCPVALGGLTVLRGSHRAGFIEHATVPGKKFAGFGLPEDRLPQDETTEWHAGDFALGDVLVFGAHTVHKALPNLTPDTLRISVDNRYQPVGTAIEPGSMATHYNL